MALACDANSNMITLLSTLANWIASVDAVSKDTVASKPMAPLTTKVLQLASSNTLGLTALSHGELPEEAPAEEAAIARRRA